jgi:error-prone DNA polymerase
MAAINSAGKFAHLHVASSYSLRYGVASPAALAERAAELGMPALALTDRDGLYGAVKHAVACAARRVKPILGADMALREGDRAPGWQAPTRRSSGGPDRLGSGGWTRLGSGGSAGLGSGGYAGLGSGGSAGLGSGGYAGLGSGGPARLLSPQAPARLHNEDAARVTLLAAGRRGWASLCRLVSAAHQAGERGAPVVTPDMVAAHAEGLIVLLGPGSDVGRAITARRPDLAAAALARWRERAEVVIEIVDHQTAGATFRAARMLQVARDAGVPAVLTNAVRYLDPQDGTLAQVLDAARQLVPLGQRPTHFAGGRAHLASATEMAQMADRVCHLGQGAGEAAELLATTARLAQRCSLDHERDLGIGGRFLPETVGAPLARLRARCEEGLDRRFPRGGRRAVAAGGSGTAGSGVGGGRGEARGRAAARERLERELDIIATTGLASYFLTVADVADLIKGQGIRCSIRGSGAGCLVNYLIGISNIDPMEHDLIMERFLSERRKGLPDIDLDVESARRIEAYRVIVGTYSEQRVACVSMMETYRARSAIRDVTAALGLPPHEADAIAKAFPHIRAAHISGALAGLPELRASGLAIPQLNRVFQLAERLDGLPRHVAMHPCGVVLSNTTLLDRTAVERSIEGLPLSQFDKDDVEAAGMIKLDVLGVRMQSAMAYALTEIERTTGERVDIDEIDHHDEPTFEMIRSARTLGCFQIESPGQRELVGKLLPRTIGDLIVDISLFRPGPVNSDMVTPYLEIRHNQRPACFPDVSLKDALYETGGVVVFHEQVLRIIDIMTGCGLSHAELIRRALSEEQYRQEITDWFRKEALKRGYDGAVVDRVWEVLAAFGAFGFCKAHAAAFAIPTYQSSWLKRHYPAAFYAGVLTHDPGMYPKRVIVGDARLLGISVLPVDINSCAGDWRVERTGQPSRDGLRPGFREVKGISDAEVARIVAGQPYESLRDFWERARVSRPIAERLVLVGAFDSLYRPNPGAPRVSRRDLLARVGVLDRSAARLTTRSVPANHLKTDTKMTRTREKKGVSASRGVPGAHREGADARQAGVGAPRAGGGEVLGARREGGEGQLLLDLGVGDGFAELVPAGELRELTVPERVEAELEILGIDLSQHVLGFYADLLAELGVVRSVNLHRCRAGSQVLVAGVKVATQTPAIRSGQRIIFATLDDATGPVDLAFFESVQDRCAARVFGSWLLAVRGRLRKVGQSVSVNGAECWDLSALAEIRAASGIGAVRAAMRAGDVPGSRPGPVRQGPPTTPKIIYPNGFALSPFAETGSPGGELKNPPRVLWHASPGSSGGW